MQIASAPVTGAGWVWGAADGSDFPVALHSVVAARLSGRANADVS